MTYRLFPETLLQVPDDTALFHPDGTGYSPYPAPVDGISALDLLDIVTSVSPRFFLIGDLGISGTGAGQTMTWADQSGGGIDYTQATDANKPTVAAQAAIGNRLALVADGTSDSLSNLTYNLVSGDWILSVFVQDAWVANDTLFGAAGTVSRYAIGQAGVEPEMRLVANTGATPNNNGAPIGTWTRARAHCVNTTSAYLRLGSTNTTGVAPGSGFGSTGRQIFGQNNGNFLNGKCALLAVWAGEPTELVAIDDWIDDWYSGGVALG